MLDGSTITAMPDDFAPIVHTDFRAPGNPVTYKPAPNTPIDPKNPTPQFVADPHQQHVADLTVNKQLSNNQPVVGLSHTRGASNARSRIGRQSRLAYGQSLYNDLKAKRMPKVAPKAGLAQTQQQNAKPTPAVTAAAAPTPSTKTAQLNPEQVQKLAASRPGRGAHLLRSIGTAVAVDMAAGPVGLVADVVSALAAPKPRPAALRTQYAQVMPRRRNNLMTLGI